jgi:hypothetical protein
MIRINLNKPKITVDYCKHVEDDRGFRVSVCCNVRTIYNYDIPGNVYEADNIYSVCPNCMAIKPETRPEKKGGYFIFNWVKRTGKNNPYKPFVYSPPLYVNVKDLNKTQGIFEEAYVKWVKENRH